MKIPEQSVEHRNELSDRSIGDCVDFISESIADILQFIYLFQCFYHVHSLFQLFNVEIHLLFSSSASNWHVIYLIYSLLSATEEKTKLKKRLENRLQLISLFQNCFFILKNQPLKPVFSSLFFLFSFHETEQKCLHKMTIN